MAKGLKAPYSRGFETVFMISEIILIILYCTCTEMGENSHPKNFRSSNPSARSADAKDETVGLYSFF